MEVATPVQVAIIVGVAMLVGMAKIVEGTIQKLSMKALTIKGRKSTKGRKEINTQLE